MYEVYEKLIYVIMEPLLCFYYALHFQGAVILKEERISQSISTLPRQHKYLWSFCHPQKQFWITVFKLTFLLVNMEVLVFFLFFSSYQCLEVLMLWSPSSNWFLILINQIYRIKAFEIWFKIRKQSYLIN